MTPFEVLVSNWLVDKIKAAANNRGREIEHLNFKTPLYVAEAEYEDGVVNGYIGVDGIPTDKFKDQFSYHVTIIGKIIQAAR